MARTIVSIISEQTIPNYIFIKEMYRDGDNLMFIASNNSKMLTRAKYIETVLTLSCKPTYIVFEKDGDEEDWQTMADTIKKYLSPEEEYVVNLTGGTKYMALTVEMIFSRYNSSFYYIPFPKNTILQLRSKDNVPIAYRTTVSEYMKLYGLPISPNSLTQSEEYATHFFSLFTKRQLSDDERDVMERLRVSYRDLKKPQLIDKLETSPGTKKYPQVPGLRAFLNHIDFPLKHPDMIDKYEVRYITGGWFEEYVYYLIRRNLHPTDIQIGVLIKSSETTNINDLDVVFTLGNKLFVVECKTAVGQESQFNQIVYKASALKETLMGLSGRSYIFSLSPEVERLRGIARNMGVEYCDQTYFLDNAKLEDLLRKIKQFAYD